MSPIFLSAVAAAQTSQRRGRNPDSPAPTHERSDPRYKLSYMIVAVSIVLLIVSATTALLS